MYQVPPDPLPPTCHPFVIPKSSEKVSLILRCIKQNKQDGSVLPTFQPFFLLTPTLTKPQEFFSQTNRGAGGNKGGGGRGEGGGGRGEGGNGHP